MASSPKKPGSSAHKNPVVLPDKAGQAAAAGGQSVELTTAQQKSAKQQANRLWVGFAFMLSGLALAAPGAAIVATVGFLPTYAALFTDTSFYRASRAQIIFAFNALGVIPVVMDVWSSGGSIGKGLGILRDVFSLAIMFMPAALGWMVVFIAPIVAAGVLQVLRTERVKSLAKERQKLLDDWGGELVSRDG